jgi:catalase-peroxidase
LSVLEPIQVKHRDALSWADLIVLAGQVAVEEAGGKSVKFCGGRVDAKDGGCVLAC